MATSILVRGLTPEQKKGVDEAVRQSGKKQWEWCVEALVKASRRRQKRAK